MNNGGCAIGGVTLMTTVASHHPDYSMYIVYFQQIPIYNVSRGGRPDTESKWQRYRV